MVVNEPDYPKTTVNFHVGNKVLLVFLIVDSLLYIVSSIPIKPWQHREALLLKMQIGDILFPMMVTEDASQLPMKADKEDKVSKLRKGARKSGR